MKVLLIALALLLVSTFASAQPITSYTLNIYAPPASATLIKTAVIPAASVTCNLAAVGGVTVNPNVAEFDDPSNPGRVCIYIDNGTGPLGTLPFGVTSYDAGVLATNSLGSSSSESLRSVSFTHPGQLPAVLTGLRIIR